MKKKEKIKKNEIIRPLDSPMLLITFLITIDAILLNYCLINDKFVDDKQVRRFDKIDTLSIKS